MDKDNIRNIENDKRTPEEVAQEMVVAGKAEPSVELGPDGIAYYVIRDLDGNELFRRQRRTMGEAISRHIREIETAPPQEVAGEIDAIEKREEEHRRTAN